MALGIAEGLLTWFWQHRRLLPFRQEPSAYHIWVSEIMLQQTRVAAALPYYERFVAELPDPAALAACPPDRLRKLWQGLGYYNRAANMQKAARLVCEQYGGSLPADWQALRALPGIGEYTAGAIASIAFGIRAPAVDGNVLRVFARLYNDDADITKPAVRRRFTGLVLDEMPPDAPGPFNEALMDLGALACLPGAPACASCPVAALCRGRWPDRVIIFVTTLFVSVPSFILATILLLVFCLQLQWVGVWSPSNPNYVLPVIALALYPMAYITRLTKSSMLDVLGQDYIRTARAKGVHEWLVIFKHALRIALIPVLT